MKTPTLGPTSLRELSQQAGFIVLRQGCGWRLYNQPTEILEADDRATLDKALVKLDRHVKAGGEAAGFLTYEAGYALEPKLFPLLMPSRRLGWFGLYDQAFTLEDPVILGEITHIKELIDGYLPAIGRTSYDLALNCIRDLIGAGDVYQVNFTYRARFQAKCTAWQLFTALCDRHPVPYAAFANTGNDQIVSLSPELFFEIRDRHITVKPMKGTADRGLTLEDDNICGEALRSSEKNRAENVMIVDLMRNDLGRICRPGSIKTSRLFEVERFPSVWQMTSTIEGELLEEPAPDVIIRALFPSGSVTGAPKIRAMEIISELEVSERDVYTGTIGYFAPTQAQFSVAIRTAILRNGEGTIGIGGGITYDSSSSNEWKESESKARFLTKSQPKFKLIETLRWDGTCELLDEHLKRMRASAEYFGFSFAEARIREEIDSATRPFNSGARKLRILLSANGSLELDCQELDLGFWGRVCISARTVLSRDRFLYHKTTNRQKYDEELASARAAQCDDVLFINEQGQLTEGAIHNIFLVKDGMWRTPLLACGLLPGVVRASVLKSRPQTFEQVLTLRDLMDADQIYLCNSMRGLYPVQLANLSASAGATQSSPRLIGTDARHGACERPPPHERFSAPS